MALEQKNEFSKDAPREDGLEATAETIRVRQGVTGHNVRYILALSLAAVVVALILIGIAISR